MPELVIVAPSVSSKSVHSPAFDPPETPESSAQIELSMSEEKVVLSSAKESVESNVMDDVLDNLKNDLMESMFNWDKKRMTRE